MVKIAFLRK